MGKIEQNKEQMRLAILEAAQGVYLTEGYILASMDKIAMQAEITKQTIYRYFPSKIALFQATLEHMRMQSKTGFLDHLDNPDDWEALYGFAVGFVQAHLTQEHLGTFRLLIAESTKEPEVTKAFFAEGPRETGTRLSSFFTGRLGINHPETPIRLWTSMLLVFRNNALVGMEAPTNEEIERHAKASIEFLLAGVTTSNADSSR